MNILKPVITEKSYQTSLKNTYAFKVDKKMRKSEIATAVAQQYGVKVIDVKTVMMATKTKRVGRTRQEVRLPVWKKAYVTLDKGHSLDFFTAPSQEAVSEGAKE